MGFKTAITLHDLLFLAQGAGWTLLITLIAVAAGTVLGVIFGVFRAVVPWWASIWLGFLLDIFRSVPDALASAAKQLQSKGWQSGERWAYEVRAPQNADCSIGTPVTTYFSSWSVSWAWTARAAVPARMKRKWRRGSFMVLGALPKTASRG
jgi:ABC-type amino acid transport system permease subunit